jgi:hypothetical protein
MACRPRQGYPLRVSATRHVYQSSGLFSRPPRAALFELDLFQQQVGHQSPQARVLELELGDQSESFRLGEKIDLSRPVRSLGLLILANGLRLSPAMKRHDADAQGSRDLLVSPPLRDQRVCLRQLGGNLDRRMALSFDHSGVAPKKYRRFRAATCCACGCPQRSFRSAEIQPADGCELTGEACIRMSGNTLQPQPTSWFATTYHELNASEHGA